MKAISKLNSSTMQRLIRDFLISTFATFIGFAMSSAAFSAEENAWQHSISTYLWIADTAVEASTRIGLVEAELAFSDAVDLLDGGLILNYKGQGERFGLIVDLISVSLADDTTLGGPFASTIDIKLDGLITNLFLKLSF